MRLHGLCFRLFDLSTFRFPENLYVQFNHRAILGKERLAITNVERKQHTLRSSSFTNTTHSLSLSRSRELVAYSSLARRPVDLKILFRLSFF